MGICEVTICALAMPDSDMDVASTGKDAGKAKGSTETVSDPAMDVINEIFAAAGHSSGTTTSDADKDKAKRKEELKALRAEEKKDKKAKEKEKEKGKEKEEKKAKAKESD